MRRLFWLGIGLALGALVFRRMSRAAEKLTPNGIVQSLGDALGELAGAVRDFTADIREGMSEQEAALREGAGLDAGEAQPPALGRHGTG